MTIKMHELLNFDTFYVSVKSQKLPIKTAYKLSQLFNAVKTNLAFYQEKFQELIKRYGQLDSEGNLVVTEDGKGIKLLEGFEQECLQAMEELDQMEVDLPNIKFSVSDFDGIGITLEDMTILMPFIED